MLKEKFAKNLKILNRPPKKRRKKVLFLFLITVFCVFKIIE